MIAYFVLLVAAATRLLPHALHGVGLNFTAVGGGLLFFGARRRKWEIAAAAGVMALTDVYLTIEVYGSAFHFGDYAVTWAWYIGVCLIGSGILRSSGVRRVAAAVVSSATSFFVLSNLVVWLKSGMYPHTGTGLVTCYERALPFYANDLVSTALTTTVLFCLPVAAKRMIEAWRHAMSRSEPLI